MRLTGEEVLLLAVHYCSRRLALVPYQITLPGAYFFEVLHLFRNFNYTGEAPLLPSKMRTTSSGHFTVDSVDPNCTTGGCRSVCTMTDTQLPGRWIASEATSLLFRTTCVFGEENNTLCEPLEELAVAQGDKAGLSWQPYSCALRSFADMGHLGKCSPTSGSQWCFVGDSQMRHIYNDVVGWSSRQPRSKVFGQTDKSVIEVDFARFLDNPWGEPTDLSDCSTVVVNFGQWHLAFTAGSRPSSVSNYMSSVAEVAGNLSLLQDKGVKVLWVTTASHGLHNHGMEHRGTGIADWRADPYLLLFNVVANAVMSHQGIPVVDSWGITAPLMDLSYDGSHYKGPVGYHVALLVMNYLCN